MCGWVVCGHCILLHFYLPSPIEAKIHDSFTFNRQQIFIEILLNAFILMWLFISSLRSFWDFTCSNSTRATLSYFYSINAACALVSQEPLEVGIHAVSDYETDRSSRYLGSGVHALPIWATPVSTRCLRGVSHMQPHLYVFLLWCTFWEQGWRPWLRVAVVASACTVFVHISLYLSIFALYLHCICPYFIAQTGWYSIILQLLTSNIIWARLFQRTKREKGLSKSFHL